MTILFCVQISLQFYVQFLNCLKLLSFILYTSCYSYYVGMELANFHQQEELILLCLVYIKVICVLALSSWEIFNST